MPREIIKAHKAQLDLVTEDAIMEYRAAGHSVKEVVRWAGINNGTEGGGVVAFYAWLKEAPGRWERWQEVAHLAAAMMNEESLEIADSGTEDNVQRDKLRIDQRRYMIERLDPAQFVVAKTAPVQVSIGTLHLTAVTAVQEEMHAARGALRAAPPAEEAEFEVVLPATLSVEDMLS